MSRKALNIGLFGFGCVGYGLYEVLEKTPGLNAQIKKICVKNPNKKREIGAENFTFNKEDLLQDSSINTIVELIDDADAAFEIVKAAVQSGKAVVTANKKMIAEHFQELLALQQQYNVPILYEAACCASIPIIRNLEEYYDNDLLESIEGIVNGSTNYILTKTAQENLSYDAALKDAQEKGYAETNPFLDTGGFDAKYKLQILLAHAFGIIATPKDIYNIGIDQLSDLELNYAKEKGYKIKLVANAVKTNSGTIQSYVLPKFIKPTDPLFNVDDVFNGVKTKSYFSDSQFFVGKGAGAHPTASAVLSDISALSYDYKYEYKKLNNTETLATDEAILLQVFLSYKKQEGFSAQDYFTNIEESYTNKDGGYAVGAISLKQIKKLKEAYPNNTSIILIEGLTPIEQSIVESKAQ